MSEQRDSKSVPEPDHSVRLDEIVGTPAQIAARAVFTCKMGESIPSRQALLGAYDQGAVMQGIVQFMDVLIPLLDTIEEDTLNPDGGLGQRVNRLRELMTPNVR
jgi:hypothetical protein